MSDAKALHPTAAQLSDFALGRLDEPASGEIERHVAKCPACQQTLEALPPDTLVSNHGGLRAGNSTSATLPTPGARVGDLPESFGRYRILKELGKGGMGAVYLVLDMQLERHVALKVPHFRPEDGPQALERFYREARAAATFDHPNLCPVHDVGQVDSVHYLTMPYIDGKPLSDLLADDKILAPRQAAALVRKLALALQEAHDKGVIHRDLKPSNVMLNRRGEPVVMDFGLARRVVPGDARLTKSGAVLGTPAYMSPEQVDGKSEAIGPPSDIYSLGVILYELLTGRLPFEGSVAAILGQIMTQAPTKPSALRPDLDGQLEALCLKALSKQPHLRYATMKDFAAALAEYLRTAGPVAPQSRAKGPAEERAAGPPLRRLARKPRPRRPRRGPRWAWIATGVAAVGLIGWLLAGVIFRVETKEGTIVIEVDQPGATVSLDGEVITITRTNDRKPVTIRRQEGRHELRVTKGGFVMFTREFSLDAGKPEQVKVTLEAKRADGKPDGPSSGTVVREKGVRPTKFLDRLRQVGIAPSAFAYNLVEKEELSDDAKVWLVIYIDGHRLRFAPILDDDDNKAVREMLAREDVKKAIAAEDGRLGHPDGPTMSPPKQPAMSAATAAQRRASAIAVIEVAGKLMEREKLSADAKTWMVMYVNGHLLRSAPLLNETDTKAVRQMLEREEVKRWIAAEDAYAGPKK